MDGGQVEKICVGLKGMRRAVESADLALIDEAMTLLWKTKLPGAYVLGLRDEIWEMIGRGLPRTPVFVYLSFFGEEDRAQFLKIGVAQNVKSRIQSHRTSNPLRNPLTMAAQFYDRAMAVKVESALLKHMQEDRVTGEWIKCMASLDACRAIAESLREVAVTVSDTPVQFMELEL